MGERSGWSRSRTQFLQFLQGIECPARCCLYVPQCIILLALKGACQYLPDLADTGSQRGVDVRECGLNRPAVLIIDVGEHKQVSTEHVKLMARQSCRGVRPDNQLSTKLVRCLVGLGKCMQLVWDTA